MHHYLPTQSLVCKLLMQTQGTFHRWVLPSSLHGREEQEPMGTSERGRAFGKRLVKLFPTQSVLHDQVEWTLNGRQHWMKYTNQLATTIQTTQRNPHTDHVIRFESISFLSTSDPLLYQASYVLYDVYARQDTVGKERPPPPPPPPLFLTYDPSQLVLEVALTAPRPLEWHRTKLLANLL